MFKSESILSLLLSLSHFDLLFIVSQSLVDHLADTGIQTLQFLVLRSHIRGHRLSGEETHQA